MWQDANKEEGKHLKQLASVACGKAPKYRIRGTSSTTTTVHFWCITVQKTSVLCEHPPTNHAVWMVCG
jgi:hypothetical protein